MRPYHPVVLVLLIAHAAGAQGAPRTLIRVLDTDGHPLPYALVSVAGGTPNIADTSGVVSLNIASRDSAKVWVRRIGYQPFEGYVPRVAAGGAFEVTLIRLARSLEAVRVVAPQNTPLARTGFYDRVERAKKGAYTAEFVSPEELDMRDYSLLSQAFTGRRTTSIAMRGGSRSQAVLLGRGRCPMTVLVDGQRVANTWQDFVETGAPLHLNPKGSQPEGREGSRLALDEIVSLREVMAIEIYPSTANAPAELIPIGGRGSCGFVAIWTGPRR